MNKCCLLLILLLLSTMLRAQSVVQEATFHLQSAEYSLSLEKSMQAYEKEFTPQKFSIMRIMALSYEKMGMMKEALHWYEQLIHPKNSNLDDRYHYAVCLKNNGQYLKAIEYFTNYRLQQGLLPTTSLVASCKQALTQSFDSTIWMVRNMEEVNTDASEFGWIRSDSGFLLTSDRRVDTTDKVNYKWTGLPYQKIFYVQASQKVDSVIVDALPAFINRSYTHAGALTLSPSGDTLIFSSSDSVNQQPQKVNRKKDQIIDVRNGLLISVRVKGKWQKPVPFLYNDKTKYQVMHPAIDRTGQFLVFASDQPGGYGGMDLYYSVKERDSFWSPPCNLGAVVNSSADEVFPVFDEAGKLRFSSNRITGRGMLDIYELSATLKKDTATGILIHLPYPFNSSADDFYLIDGEKGKKYFSSNRPGGKGLDDIYEVEQKNKPVVKLYFSYGDTTEIERKSIQSFVGMKDLRTRREWLQILSPDGSFILPIADSMEQRIEYYSANGKKYVVDDTIRYHPAYPTYGIIKKYPAPQVPESEEKESVIPRVILNNAGTSTSKKKKMP